MSISLVNWLMLVPACRLNHSIVILPTLTSWSEEKIAKQNTAAIFVSLLLSTWTNRTCCCWIAGDGDWRHIGYRVARPGGFQIASVCLSLFLPSQKFSGYPCHVTVLAQLQPGVLLDEWMCCVVCAGGGGDGGSCSWTGWHRPVCRNR